MVGKNDATLKCSVDNSIARFARARVSPCRPINCQAAYSADGGRVIRPMAVTDSAAWRPGVPRDACWAFRGTAASAASHRSRRRSGRVAYFTPSRASFSPMPSHPGDGILLSANATPLSAVYRNSTDSVAVVPPNTHFAAHPKPKATQL